MSLTSDDYDKISFYTDLNIDKIVGVWEGSFHRTNDVTARVAFSTLYVHAIPHGFTRPVFVDLLWSTDGTTWSDGGISHLAFSDSSNIYITSGFSTVAGTMYYKAIGFWIDNYDTTNPLVPEYHQEGKPVIFDSRLNYQKIIDEDVVTLAGGTFNTVSTETITHNLGYKPNAKVYFEAFTGEVWPLNAGGSQNPFNYDFSQDEMDMAITDTQMRLRLFGNSDIDRRAWYRIYADG